MAVAALAGVERDRLSGLIEADPEEVREALRIVGGRIPAALPNLLVRLATWVQERFDGDFDEIDSVGTSTLRDELRQIKGLGPILVETLLLFGFERPVLALNRASYRVLVRHGWIDPETDFDEAREQIEGLIADDLNAAQWLSEGLSQIGRSHCRLREPQCSRCPLQAWLPEDGPREPDPTT